MTCDQIRPNLLAYLDGEVSDAERAQIEAHLSTCAACASELTRLQSLQDNLREVVPAGLAQLHLSREAEARIRARIRKASVPSRGRFEAVTRALWPRVGWAKAAIPLVVVLFVLATAFFSVQPLPVSAQETVVVVPAALTLDTDAALRVIVREPNTTRPISGAEVSVSLRPQGEDQVVLYTGRTGNDGTADVRFHVPSYERDNLEADLVVTATSTHARDHVVQQIALRRNYRLLLTSDKPLYRPGQTIHQRVLSLYAARQLPATGRPVRFTVQGPSGERLAEKTVRTSDYGIASADYVLPPYAPHGTYRLIAALGNATSERTVTVGQYARPQFKVDVSTDRGYYLPLERVSGRVTAQTLDEQPLPGAEVTLCAYILDPDRRLIATAQGRTDGSGAFGFALVLPEPEAFDEDPKLVLETSVANASGHLEWAGRVLPVAMEPLVIDVVPEGGHLRPGVTNRLYVLTANPEGAPVRSTLDVDIDGQSYKLASNEYGLAEFRFVPPAGVREMPVQVTASDGDGRIVTRTTVLSASQGPAQVLLRLDRAAYEVGETMHLEVLSGQGGVVYLDVTRREGGQTLQTTLARLRDGRAELDVDVSPEMAGTLELHAYQVLPDGTVARDARLAVVDAPTEIEVDISSDRPAYHPGEVARVTVDTRIDGAPAQSALGIAVVDESVFALEDRAPGFAKLFFLLEASLIDLQAHPLGITLPDLIDPPVDALRAAQDTAARAAWARLPAGDLTFARSVVTRERLPGWIRQLSLGLGVVTLCIPAALWGVVLGWLRRAGLPRTAWWRTATILVGLAFVFVLPATVLVIIGLRLVLGETFGAVLLALSIFGWLAMLILIGIESIRQRDSGIQIVVLLFGAYGILGTLMGYVAERGRDLGPAFALGAAGTFLLALAALLVLAAGLWLLRRRVSATATVMLVLCTVSIVALVGTIWESSSPLVRTIVDPQLYAGPVGWLAGCAQKSAPAAPGEEAKESESIQQTVEVEKEVTKVVEKEVVVTATAAPTRTPVPALPTPQPQSTASPPRPVPTATASAEPTLPPPLLGQYIPETIFWLPEAVTDVSGHLALDIALPDVPATWRLTMLASNEHGELGAATALLSVADR